MQRMSRTRILPAVLAMICVIGLLALGLEASETTSWGRVKATYRSESVSTTSEAQRHADPPPEACACLEPYNGWFPWHGGWDCIPPMKNVYVILLDGTLCVRCMRRPHHPDLLVTPRVIDDDDHATSAQSGALPSEAPESGAATWLHNEDWCALLNPAGKWVVAGELTPEDCNRPYSYFAHIEFFLGPRCVSCVENVCE